MIQSGSKRLTHPFTGHVPFSDGFQSAPWVVPGISGFQSAALGFEATVVEGSITPVAFVLRAETFAGGIDSATVVWIAHGTSQGKDNLTSGSQVCPAMGPHSTQPFVIDHGLGFMPSGVVVALSQLDAKSGRLAGMLATPGPPSMNGFELRLVGPDEHTPVLGFDSVIAMWLAHDHTRSVAL